MSYKFPDSSSPAPSTPDKKYSNVFSFGASNDPSTTPVGPPPPSSAASYTPAGAPPASQFGSSSFGASSMKPISWGQQSYAKSSPPAAYGRPPMHGRSRLSNEFHVSHSSEYEDGEDEDEADNRKHTEEQYSEDEMEDDRSYEEEDREGMDIEEEENEDDRIDQSESGDSRSDIMGFNQSRQLGLFKSTTDIVRQSRETEASDILGFRYQAIARSLYKQMEEPPVDEQDDLVLTTEATITRLYAEGIGATDEQDMLAEALNVIPAELIALWDNYSKNETPVNEDEYTPVIGPGPNATDFAKANFVGGLALNIHHPTKLTRTFGSFDRKVTPLPQVLLTWMEANHRPIPSQIETVLTHRPSPANHSLFWESLFDSILQGKVQAVVNILKDAGWAHAKNGSDDPRDGGSGFSGVALSNIERVVNAAVEVLSQCPAIHGDWNIRSSDWQLFRLKIAQSLEALKTFAEGNSKDRRSGMMDSTMSQSAYGRTARKAESQVPWHIYRNLVNLYNLVLGDKTTIIESCQDWLEATVGLLIWWDESKEDRRLASRKIQTFRANRESDEESYLRKLKSSFNAVTHSSNEFEINTADEVEVALAAIFEGDNESVIGFLRGWSGPLSAAVAEIASLGGWLPQAKEKDLMEMDQELDQGDFDVLGLHSSPLKEDGVKDMTLKIYANGLSHRGQLRSSSQPPVVREGWELALSVLGRLDSTAASEEMVGSFLGDFALESSATVDKLWRLLNDLGMSRHAEDTAESYADYLAEGSHKYGEALWYYSLAHKTQKVKDVLDLLISFSLIQSTAYPTTAELDDHLKNLVSSPRATLTEMSHMDLQAAQLLQKSLSGYATLRRFYDLRDEEVHSPNQKPSKSAAARKIEAASALMAVVISSDDNIRGGLYEEEREAVVNVDFLFALLGEALVFVNQPDYTPTTSQINTLLKSIEDLQSVGPRVYGACTEFLQTVLASGQGMKGSSPSDMLHKTTSDVSGTSGSFSMVGSLMLASQMKQSMSSSRVLVKGNIKRGWDWRKGVAAGTTGDELLRILRLGLAKDLARAWVAEVDGMV